MPQDQIHSQTTTPDKLLFAEFPPLVFFGTPDFAVPVLNALQKNYQVAAIVTAPDKPVGRHRTLTPSPVAQAAPTQIPLLKPKQLGNETIQQLQNLKPGLFIVAAYGKIIPQELLDIPALGALNIHPSLLPKYRGPSPVQNAILNGDNKTGVTIIKMDAQMDHGPIVSAKEYRLSQSDNYLTLGNKLFQTGAKDLLAILPDFINGKTAPQPQNHAETTYTKIITKENGFFDINNPPSTEKLDRMVRAFYPWPTAWTRWNNKVVKFLPGTLVQIEGKKPVPLKDFLNGHPDFSLKN